MKRSKSENGSVCMYAMYESDIAFEHISKLNESKN